MGNKPLSPVAAACSSLQQALLNEREQNINQIESLYALPRSTKVDGRFVLTKEHFPDYINQSSLSNLYAWRRDAEPHPSYTEQFLEENLPVTMPDVLKLARGNLE